MKQHHIIQHGHGPLRRPTLGRSRTGRSSVLALALALGLGTGCTPTINTHGYMADKDVIAEVKKPQHNRQSITKLLGTPSARATFGPEAWYYIGKRTKSSAFLRPELLERRILVVRFDDAGAVTEVSEFDTKKDKEIKLVERITPTHGKELGLIEQLIGNLGRFSTGEQSEGLGP